MTSKIKFLAVLMLIASVFVLTSCKKKKSEETSTPNVQSETDNSEMEQETAALISFADDGGSNTNGMTSPPGAGWTVLPLCASFDIDTLPGADSSNSYWPRRLTVTFASGCVCWDNRTRSGQVIFVFTGPWRLHNIGDSCTVTLNNYYVDNVKHFGTRYFIHQDTATLRIVAVDCGAEFSDGTTREWRCDRTRKRIAGFGTPYNFLDDVYELAGTAEGKNRKGTHFLISTRSGNPLIRKMDCRYLVQGILDITPDNLSTRSIDWGNGNCDDIVTVTVDGRTITIHLR